MHDSCMAYNENYPSGYTFCYFAITSCTHSSFVHLLCEMTLKCDVRIGSSFEDRGDELCNCSVREKNRP